MTTRKTTNAGLRKAAILVASLDQAAADVVLEQLTPEQARHVRRLAVELEDIDRQEQQRIIDEFFRIGPLLPGQCPPGIELDDGLARRLAQRPAEDIYCQPAVGPRESEPFRFLREAESDKLSRLLGGERPQTIALVLSHLPPQQAGSVLARLQPALQAEVVRRLVDLEETAPEILREVEEALQSRLSAQVQMQRRRVAGLAAVTGILQAADGRTGMKILDNLADHDQNLAERLRPQPPAFDALAEADGHVLAAVVRVADRNVLLTALIGAAPELVERLLAELPGAEAARARRELDRPGPLRLRDVEEARRQIARLAQREMPRRQEYPQSLTH
ncbi:MAG: FliG C-terminal domain-containing protein [Thermoguttaceae bacterium]